MVAEMARYLDRLVGQRRDSLWHTGPVEFVRETRKNFSPERDVLRCQVWRPRFQGS